MNPDLNSYILLNEKKGLVPGYPQSMLDILGKSNVAAVHGPLHKVMRNAFLSILNPTIMRENVFPKIDTFMSSHLSNWSGKIIDLQENTKEVCMHVQMFFFTFIYSPDFNSFNSSDGFSLVIESGCE